VVGLLIWRTLERRGLGGDRGRPCRFAAARTTVRAGLPFAARMRRGRPDGFENCETPSILFSPLCKKKQQPLDVLEEIRPTGSNGLVGKCFRGSVEIPLIRAPQLGVWFPGQAPSKALPPLMSPASRGKGISSRWEGQFASASPIYLQYRAKSGQRAAPRAGQESACDPRVIPSRHDVDQLTTLGSAPAFPPIQGPRFTVTRGLAHRACPQNDDSRTPAAL